MFNSYVKLSEGNPPKSLLVPHRSGPHSSALVPLQGVPCNASSAWPRPLGSRCWKAGALGVDDGKMGENLGKIWKNWGNSRNKLGKVLKIMEHDSRGKVGKMKTHSGK